ncbi:MAG: YnbE family lipoprotein [Blastomonas sp.]
MTGKWKVTFGRSGRAVTAGALGAMLVAVTMLPAGCVNVTAPDKPIVIELNINIRQEVVYRLDGAVDELIDENAEIF